MKIKPTTYAQLLIANLEDKPDFKDLAKRLWYLLQKNKQYRDLPKILDALEKVYAEKEGFTIAYVESGEELSETEIEKVKSKLTSYCHFDSTKSAEKSHEISRLTFDHAQVARDDKRIILKTKINPSITGIVVKIEGRVIDLSVEDKIQGLRKALARNG